MTRSKKLFLTGAAVFAILLFYASYDISNRTSFPGSRPQLKERIKQRYGPTDSVHADTSVTKKQKF